MKYQTTNILRLTNRVRKKIQTEKLFNSSNLIITFSGGQDSAFCLLVLYLLNNQIKKSWNREKVLTLSKNDTEKTLIKQRFYSNLCLDYAFEKQSIFTIDFNFIPAAFCSEKLKTFLTTPFKPRTFGLQRREPTLPLPNLQFGNEQGFGKKLRFDNEGHCQSEDLTRVRSFDSTNKVTIISGQIKFGGQSKANASKQDQPINNCLIDLPNNSHTLLWCNHFWQKDTFFTMEHVFKLGFSKNYTIYSFLPVKKISSEQRARYWRHQAVERLSLFILQIQRHYELVELYFNSVFVAAPFLSSKPTFAKKQSDDFEERNKQNQIPNISNEEQIGNKNVAFVQTVGQSKSGNQDVVFNMLNSKKKKVFFDTNNAWHRFHLCNQNLVTVKTTSQNKLYLNKMKVPLCSNLASTKFEQLCVQGHNKSDRAEAIFFNLIRGTGINGLSTLQWKHTFFPPSNSNCQFYSVFFDFFKEIQIIYLDFFFFKVCSLKTKKIKKNRSTFYINRKNIRKMMHPNLEEIINQKQLGLPVFSKKFLVRNKQKDNKASTERNKYITTKNSVDKFDYNNVNQPCSEFSMSLRKHVKSFYYQLKYKNIFDHAF